MDDRPCELTSLHKLVIFVHTPDGLFLHFFGNVVEEAAPFGRWTKLRNVKRCHLYALVGNHDKAAAGEVMHVVDVRRRCYRREVGSRLQKHTYK